MFNLDRKLLDNVFKLIEIDKVNNFKTALESSLCRSKQIKNLFDELHDFVINICIVRQSTELKNDLEHVGSSFTSSTVQSSMDKSVECDQLFEQQIKRTKLVNRPDRNSLVDLTPYLIACDVLKNYFYDSLNQGKWFKVSTQERFAYGLVTLYTVLIKMQHSHQMDCNEFSNDCLMNLLKKIDYGLIYSPPFLNNLLARIATLLHDHLIIRLPISKDYDFIDFDKTVEHCSPERGEQQIDKLKQVKRVRCLDLEDFNENYFMKKEPVIIENAIDDWPAVQRWNLHFLLNKAAYRLVPVEIGSRYTDQNWTQKVITLREFIEKFILNSNDLKGYLAQYELFDRIEQLSGDFYIPDYCALSNFSDDRLDKEKNVIKLENKEKVDQDDCDVHINAWFGPSNTISPLHQDPKDNLLAQVFGSKYIRLYSPKIPDENYYLHNSNLLKNTSQVDVENIDRSKFSNFPQHYQEAILKKGEILYIPEKHWHYVRSLSTSFSISFWWK